VGPDFETKSLGLLRDIQKCLAGVLDSLGSKQGENLFEHYIFFTSTHVNRSAEGFILLRENRRFDPSKLLVRPAVEMMISQQAVLRKPELLYRIAYTELEERKKWLVPLWKRIGRDFLPEHTKQLKEFSRNYASQFPSHIQKAAKITLIALAESAKLEGFYDSHYRLYCQFTHGAFEATTGELDFADCEDNHTMTLCVLSTLTALHQGVKVDIPELSSFTERVKNLSERQ
jgi:hypothetical protein